MAFSTQLVERAQRTERQCETTKEIFTSLLEPFRLIDLYPEIEEEVKPGIWKKRKEIQQHQKKLHDGIAPSGRNAKAVLFSGGFGCTSGKTNLYDPVRDETRTFEEWAEAKIAPYVWSIDREGNRVIGKASVPFIKRREMMYRVQTESKSILVAKGHKFLTAHGWRKVSDLSAGESVYIQSVFDEPQTTCSLSPQKLPAPETASFETLIASVLSHRKQCGFSSDLKSLVSPAQLSHVLCAPLSSGDYVSLSGRLLSSSDSGLLIRPLSDRSFSHRGKGSPGSCLPYRRLYDERPLWDREDDLAYVPSQGDAHGHNLRCLHRDVQDETAGCSRLYPQSCLPSNSCGDVPAAPLPSGLMEYHVSSETCKPSLLTHRTGSRSECQSTHPALDSESLPILDQVYSYNDPPSSYYIITEDIILDISEEDEEDVYDIEVLRYANYIAEGFLNSNSGKTRALCAQMYALMRKYPSVRIVCTTAFDYYFDEFLLPTWNEVLPEDSPHIKSFSVKSRTLKLTNGSQIRFHAYDDPNRIRGWEAHVIWIEEAAEIGDGNNEKAIAIFNALLGRLRASKPRYPLRIYVSQNPRGHNWVWKLFIRPEPTAPQPLGDTGKATQLVDRFGNPIWKRDKRGNPIIGEPVVYREWEKETVSGDIFYTISSGTHSNQYVPRGYVDTMLGNYADTPGLKERLVDGMFTPVNTLVYELPWFSTHTHCINYQDFLDYWEVSEIPFYWPVIVGIDCAGARSPWAVEYYVLAGGVEGGHWVGFDEIYEKGLTWGEIADKILAKGKRYENIRYFIDPISSNQRSGPLSETIKEEFQRRGIPTTPPKRYNKHGGIAKVHSFLRRDHSIPCPYKVEDVQIEDEQGNLTWEIGHSQLYYMKNMPGKRIVADGRVYNEEGYGMPANIAEKGVYRWDDRKQSEGSEAEEGLTPVQSEKVMDRDDHAQTAEMFCLYGMYPDDTRERAKRTRNAPDDDRPKILYGQSRRRRVF